MTPEILDRSDVTRLFRVMNARAFYQLSQKPFDKWTPSEIKIMLPLHMKAKALKDKNE